MTIVKFESQPMKDARHSWQPIDRYDGKSDVLFRDADGTSMFGSLIDGGWHEILDGQTILIDDFEPTEFTVISDDMIADYVFM